MIDTSPLNENIHGVVSHYVKLKKHGANYIGLCPFHDEKSPSFTVSKSKGIYKCFGCGKSGDAIAFVMEHEKKTFHEAVKIVSDIENIPYTQKEHIKNEIIYTKPIPRLQKVSDTVVNYFDKYRHISNYTLLRFKITDSIRWMPKAKTEIPVIEFNYYMNDELVNVKCRGKNKDFLLHKGAMLTFYNIDAIEGCKTAYIVEGEIDVLSLHEAGIYNVIGVPNGTPPVGSELNLAYVENCMAQLNAIEEFILFTDNDNVGRWLRNGLALRLGYKKCKTVRSYKYGKDANEILVKHGKNKLKEICDNAYPFQLNAKYSFNIKRFLLTYFSSSLLRENMDRFGFKTIIGEKPNKVRVTSVLLVFSMWLAIPEYTWTCTEDAEISMSEAECMDIFKPGCIVDGAGRIRTIVNKELNYPDNW